ncbi:aminotransferase class IV family protein [Yinghuangia seranimata]|uniref:aminotransferase class IV family protein n=1 Tax=Yinghuangia seranimata TaxID=408067 RepID=UPI00248AC472|nr:aminotransferase class IV family protein [Yinghuangia seranimata]MDI2130665.1 aminotransferase class IV family protein [Yinghuangia seranimata]
MSTNVSVVRRNGRPATAEDLAPLAFAGYAHFTAMQVRGGRVRGLDLHLARLRSASVELFGRARPDEQVREWLREALREAPEDVSLRAAAYLPSGTLDPRTSAEPDLLVRVGPPSFAPAGPLALMSVEYERLLPHIKHTGELAKTHFVRQAVARGFDDVAFVDRRGRLGEASIWNLAFWDGTSVVWPDAPVLVGTTMAVVRRRLDRLGVPQRVVPLTRAELPGLAGGVVMNSWSPGVAVGRIDDVPLPDAAEFVALLHRAYEAEPPVTP